MLVLKTASDVEDGEADEVLRLVGSVDDIWSEVVLSSEKNTWNKCAGAGDVWNFGGVVEEASKKIWHFRLKEVAVADSDCDEDDWERKIGYF